VCRGGFGAIYPRADGWIGRFGPSGRIWTVGSGCGSGGISLSERQRGLGSEEWAGPDGPPAVSEYSRGVLGRLQ